MTRALFAVSAWIVAPPAVNELLLPCRSGRSERRGARRRDRRGRRGRWARIEWRGGGQLQRVAGRVAAAAAEHRAQGLGYVQRFGILEVDDEDVAAAATGRVQLLDERARAREPRRTVGAHQEAIGARVRDHGHALLQIGRAPRRARGVSEQAIEDLHHVDRRRIAQGHDDGLTGGRDIERGDDAVDALQVVGVVGDDQRVAGRDRGDAVVGRDQRSQHVDQLRRRLVLERVDLGHQAIAAGGDRPMRYRRGMLLGIRLGHDLGHALALHRREPLQAQRGEQRGVDQAHRHRPGRDDIDDALDPGVEHEVAPGHLRHRPDHRLDVGIDEVQRHRLVASASRRRRKQGKSAAARTKREMEVGTWRGSGARAIAALVTVTEPPRRGQ